MRKGSLMAQYAFIDSQSGFESAFGDLLASQFLSVDTESSGFYTYYSEVCLIQISTESRHFLIDVLAGIDLSKLGVLFQDSSHRKIFHAATSDMTELSRQFQWQIGNLFDTYMAAKYLRLDGASLQSVVERYTGIRLEKKEQKSDWKRRPLSKAQLDYAHLDTLYLHSVMAAMKDEIEKEKLTEEFESEMQWLCRKPADAEGQSDVDDHNSTELPGWSRVSGVSKLTPDERGRFAAIYELREERAKAENIAPFRLLTNQGMTDMATNINVKSLADLRYFRMNPMFLKKDGNELIRRLAVASPVMHPALPRRRKTEADELIESKFQKLKAWREKIIANRKLEPALILSNRVLFKIAKQQPEDIDQLQNLQLMSEWKLHHYGSELLRIVN